VPGLFEALAYPLLLLAPFCWLSGAAFGSLVALFPAQRLYLWESVGGLAGGVFAAFGVVGRAPFIPVVAAIGAAVGLLNLRLLGRLEALGGFLLCCLLTAGAARYDGVRPGFSGMRLLDQKESRYGWLAVAGVGDMKVFLVNGVASASFPDRSAEEDSTLWPLLAHPAPKQVLVLGAGSLPALPEILKHPVERVTVVDADGEAMAMVRRHLDEMAAKAVADPRVALVVEDPREHLAGARGLDVVLSMGGEPLNAGSNRFFTSEFFSEVKTALAPNGILAFSLPSAENYLSPETAYAGASVLKSLDGVFGPHRALIPGSRMTLLAGLGPVRLDEGRLAEAYGRRRLKNTALVPPAFPYYLMPERRMAVEARLASLAGVAANSDMRPAACFHAWRLWLVKFVSPAHLLGLIAAVCVGLWGVARLWSRRSEVFPSWESGAVLSLGLSGVGLEIVLLLAFQSASGSLYWKAGLLMASFMAGLALGSLLGWRTPRAWSRGALRCILALMAAAAFLAAGWLDALVGLGPLASMLAFCGSLLGAGLLVGAAYPLACAHAPAEVYAVDLWGSALGAFLTAAFLVPLAGMKLTLILAGAAVLPALAWPGARKD
jgi:spermidine synthase